MIYWKDNVLGLGEYGEENFDTVFRSILSKVINREILVWGVGERHILEW